MKCEACGENEATVHFKQVSDGVAREMHLCETCASETDFNMVAQASVTDILFGGTFQAAPAQAGSDKECPVCRMKESDFRRLSRLGCASCYEAFSEELAPLLKAMHKGSMHAGKVPACERMSAELTSLELEMEDAIARQDFEGAAKLRDRIKGLKAKHGAGTAGTVNGHGGAG